MTLNCYRTRDQAMNSRHFLFTTTNVSMPVSIGMPNPDTNDKNSNSLY
jgi:hypothetical protein